MESKTQTYNYNDLREAKGAALFVNGHVCMTEDCFYVQSETDANQIYKVTGTECECPDFQKRQKTCKHLYAIDYYFIANGERS